MEPLSALSLAGNIVQFVQFSAKLVKKASEIRSSASGTTEELEDATIVSQSLQCMLQGMRMPTIPTSIHDKPLVDLAKGCSELCQELQGRVEHIKGKGVSSRTGSFGIAWRTLTRSGKLNLIEQRLDRYRSEILSHILFMIRQEQSTTHALIESLVQKQDAYAQGVQEALSKTRDQIINQIESELRAFKLGSGPVHLTPPKDTNVTETRTGITDLESPNHTDQLLGRLTGNFQQPDTLAEIRASLIKVSDSVKIIGIRKWLWFPGMHDRERAIMDAHKNTFTWLLHDQEIVATGNEDISQIPQKKPNSQVRQERRHAMTSWLETGRGVFWISGKAGSGKSTLMKYLARDQVTHERLETWATGAGKQLIFGEFFFWRPGSALQGNIEGLYRGVLWEVLKNCPALTQRIFPSVWADPTRAFQHIDEHRDPTMAELEAAFDKMVKDPEALRGYRVCLFIDGLDEYTNDYWPLCKLLVQWCQSDDIKICTSSRPNNEFETWFGGKNGTTWFSLHELTQPDMFRFVRDIFQKDERYMKRRTANREYETFMAAIVDRANGVFLWVQLVIKDLLVAMGNGSSLRQLNQRLSETPADLRLLFREMISRVHETERRRLARSIMLLLFDEHGFDLHHDVFTHKAMDDMDDDPGLETKLLDGSPGPFSSQDELISECENMRQRLIFRGQGLLEVTSREGDLSKQRVHFIHRTISDFLKEKDTKLMLQKWAGEFDPTRTLVYASLANVKFRPRNIFSLSILSYVELIVLLSSGTLSYINELQSLKRMILSLEDFEWYTSTYYRLLGDDKRYLDVVTYTLQKTADFEAELLFLMIHEDISSAVTEEMIKCTSGALTNGPYAHFLLTWIHASQKNEIPAVHLIFDNYLPPNKEKASTVEYCEGEEGVTAISRIGTHWTLFLLTLSLTWDDWRNQKMEALSFIKRFISNGADLSICFVGYRLGIGAECSTGKMAFYYTDLKTMLGVWDLGSAKDIEKLLRSYSKRKGLRDVWNRLGRQKKLATEYVKPLLLEQGGVAKFQVVHVVPWHALDDAMACDLERASSLFEGGKYRIKINI